MRDFVATRRELRVHAVLEPADDELVLDLADTHQVRAGAAVHLHDHGGELLDLPVAQGGRPTDDVVTENTLRQGFAPDE